MIQTFKAHLYLLLQRPDFSPRPLVLLDEALVLPPQGPDLHLELHVEVTHALVHVRAVLPRRLLVAELVDPGRHLPALSLQLLQVPHFPIKRGDCIIPLPS